jgi:nucleoside 2-deoxyribosyltransferase
MMSPQRGGQRLSREEIHVNAGRWDVFLAAALRRPGCLERNAEIIRLLRSLGMTVFAPQEQLPLGGPASADEIVGRNLVGLEESRLLLFVPEGAGEGVYYEVGYAQALGVPVYGYSPREPGGASKVELGVWARLPPGRRVYSLEQLRAAMLTHQSAMAGDRT